LLTVVNLHPEKEAEDQIPSPYDYDMTKDRVNDIRFLDKTEYDLKMALALSDYHDFAEYMTDLAQDAIGEITQEDKVNVVKDLKEGFQEIINSKQRTLIRSRKLRSYHDLIGKRFDIDDVIKIQRKDDVHTISDKIFDFSAITISNLIEEGERDALHKIVKHEEERRKWKKDKDEKNQETIRESLTRFIEDVKSENTEYDGYILSIAHNLP
jgi:NTE family protein